MKVAYFQCQSGASGDMILGALVDAGLPLATLQQLLSSLPLDGYELRQEPVVRRGLRGTKVDVHLADDDHDHGHHHDHHHHEHRNLTDIVGLIEASSLTPRVKERSIAVFRRLAEAEARAHGCAVEEVHFHEVGAVDSIVDTVGAVAGLDALGIERVYVSPLNVGEGTVKTAHGLLPVPAPATANLLTGVPVYSSGIQTELVTPTAAALFTTLAAGFGPSPAMRIQAVGYGAGTKDLKEQANLLRVFIGEVGGATEAGSDEVAVLEATIDDMNPQEYDVACERLFAAGALDVFLTAVQMKKFRPGVLLTVVAPTGSEERLAAVMIRETSTLGVRFSTMRRIAAARELTRVETPFGSVTIKVGSYGEMRRATPEYEDCARLARQHGVTVAEVMAAARRAFSGSAE